MPQFDQLSFLNQVSFILFIFINFYFFITYYFLPKISKNLKIRQKKIKINKYYNSKINFEKINENLKLILLYKKIYSNLNFFLQNIKKNINFKTLKNELLLNNSINKKIISFFSIFYLYPIKFKN